MEEESAKCLVERNVRSWLSLDDTVRIRVHTSRGRPDLLENLPRVLSGYADMRGDGADIRVAVLVDRDDDCTELKAKLDTFARRAGLVPRCDVDGGVFHVLNRVAIRELENWYFGDWGAVRAAFPKVRSKIPARYAGAVDVVDSSAKASDTLRRVLRANGIPDSGKPECARRIGPHMEPQRNTSASFRAFVTGLRELVAAR